MPPTLLLWAILSKLTQFILNADCAKVTLCHQILYNFAINPLLCHLEKLSGVLVRGQPPIKVLAFADDCVLGINDSSDSHIASQIISNYKKVFPSQTEFP